MIYYNLLGRENRQWMVADARHSIGNIQSEKIVEEEKRQIKEQVAAISAIA